MKLKEYTTTDLVNLNAEEICFAVKGDPDFIDYLTTITDDLEEAKRIAKEKGYQIYIYEKKAFKRLVYRIPDDLCITKTITKTWFGYNLLGVLKDD